MQTNVDSAVSAAQVAEATYLASSGAVVSIQAAIASDTAPLPAAQAQAASDAAAYSVALQLAVVAIQAQIVALAPPAPGAASAAAAEVVVVPAGPPAV
jgi:hypothetical protein